MEISEKNGYIRFDCDQGISSKTFIKDNFIYKVSTRNSLSRARQDYIDLKNILIRHGLERKLQKSELFKCLYNGQNAVCVKQKIISGKTIAEYGEKNFARFLKKNQEEVEFLKMMINVFFRNIESKQLYPDLVGNPSDQSIFNSINLIIEEKRGLVICDVGLSPHEKTLLDHGLEFFDSENVKHYQEKMTETLLFLGTL